MKVRNARTAVLAAAVVATLATGGGLAYGSAADNDGGTAGAATGKAAPTVSSAGTQSMVPRQGVKPSRTIPQGATHETQPRASRQGRPSTVVDSSDRGAKNVRPTKDKGTKNLPATQDLGDR